LDHLNRRRWTRWIVIIVVIVVLSALGSLVAMYTDWLWFRDMGHVDVFFTPLWAKIVAGLVFGAIGFVLLWVNGVIARRMAPRVSLTDVSDTTSPALQAEMTLARVRKVVEPYANWVLLGVCLFFAWTLGMSMTANWDQFLVALNAVPFGKVDPQFGRDIAFYLVQLPVLRSISDWLTGALVLTLVVTTVVHLLDGAIRPWDRLKAFEPHVKAHLSVLAGLIVAARALDYWVSIYELNLSNRGQVLGASFTDVNAQIPAYQILIVLALITGVALLLNIRYKGWRLPIVALGVWIGASILVGSVYPALVQQFRVAPNELVAETPYIKRNISSTREAFDLNSIDVQPFAATTDLTANDVQDASATISNIRLWDPSIVVQSYKQLQEIRFYYDFKDVDIDRYVINGIRQEVLISAREMNESQLSTQAQTWLNQHLVYTHGYGAVVSPVNAADSGGLPVFIVKDLPPKSSTDLQITQPGIYYGEETTDYAVVDTAQKEFDYPVGGQNAFTSYKAKNGIPVGGLLDRLAFAIRFGDSGILLSQAITPNSRLLYRRTISDRVKTLAPWLTLDGDPYLVISKGHLVWIMDGYTTSDMYPYSQRLDGDTGINYIRNSVKVTVDAYDGVTTLYAFDPKDPILATYRRIFPGLITDMSRMPSDIRAHLRYPEQLFLTQAEMYKTYHMLDPQVFYNKEDQWALPGEAKGSPMSPYYVLMRLPRQSSEAFMLMLPFTPRSKDNMIAWMAAKSDPSDYGMRIVYQFPKQKVVLGPEQVGARVNQDPVISPQLTLWNQQGSTAPLGNLLVIPIKESLVYIQPLYLKSESSAMPELTRVIVVYGDSVAMEADLTTALLKVFGAASGGSTGTTGTVTPGGIATGGTVAQDAAQAKTLYDQALAAQRNGDWATYGQLIKQLGDVLARIAQPSAATTSGAGK
jgi:uncharacterized membrane protein (UPF0182 family)